MEKQMLQEALGLNGKWIARTITTALQVGACCIDKERFDKEFSDYWTAVFIETTQQETAKAIGTVVIELLHYMAFDDEVCKVLEKINDKYLGPFLEAQTEDIIQLHKEYVEEVLNGTEE